MARIVTYIMILVGVMGTFAILGLGDSTTSELLRALSFDSPSGVKGADFFKIFFGSTAGVVATLGAITSLFVGLFRSQTFTDILIATATTTFMSFMVGDIYSMFTNVMSQTSIIDVGFISPVLKVFMMIFLAGAVVSAVQWWRGADG